MPKGVDHEVVEVEDNGRWHVDVDWWSRLSICFSRVWSARSNNYAKWQNQDLRITLPPTAGPPNGDALHRRLNRQVRREDYR